MMVSLVATFLDNIAHVNDLDDLARGFTLVHGFATDPVIDAKLDRCSMLNCVAGKYLVALDHFRHDCDTAASADGDRRIPLIRGTDGDPVDPVILYQEHCRLSKGARHIISGVTLVPKVLLLVGICVLTCLFVCLRCLYCCV
jgi:hypothetical protein